MKDYMDVVDRLLNQPCYIIDFLPQTVPANANGQYFDVEYYLLNSEKHVVVRDRFVRVILKMMCYYRVCVLWNGWIEKPNPKLIDDAVSEIMTNHSGTLNIVFPDENALLVFDWDSLYLAVYNPPEEMRHIFEQAARSEGLFWRATL